MQAWNSYLSGAQAEPEWRLGLTQKEGLARTFQGRPLDVRGGVYLPPRRRRRAVLEPDLCSRSHCEGITRIGGQALRLRQP